MSLDDIYKLFNFKCNYTHNTCRDIALRIINYHNSGNNVTNDFFTSYLLYIGGSDQYYYDKCICRMDICNPAIKLMLEYLIPSDENMIILSKFQKVRGYTPQILCDNSNIQIDIFKIIVGKKIKIPTIALDTALLEKNMGLANYLIDHVNPNESCLESACACNNSFYIVNLIIAQKIPISEKAVINAIRLNNESVVNLLFHMGFDPNENCLIEACKMYNKTIIDKILLCKVNPTKACFDALICSATLSYNKNKESARALEISILINMLIKNGYIITYDDVYNALSHGCYIDNIKRLNIEFDSKFIEECTKLGYYPYDNLNVKPTMNCLYAESKRVGNVPTIKKIVSQGLKPDIECLRMACDTRTNMQNIKYFVEVHGIKPNLECLKTLAKQIGNVTLTYLLNNFQETHQIVPNKDNIGTNTDVDMDVDMDVDVVDVDDVNVNNKDDTDNVNTEINTEKNLNIKQENAKDQTLKIEEHTNISKKIIGKIKDKLNVIIEDDISENDISENDINKNDISENGINNLSENQKYAIVEIKSDNIGKINNRSKYLLQIDAIKLLGLKKGTRSTFLDARKNLITYINKNNLMDLNRKDLIKPNDELIKLLKIKNNQYIDFNDINNIVYCMLKIEKN